MLLRHLLIPLALCAAWPAAGQTTTPITLANISGMLSTQTFERPIALNGTGVVKPFGTASVSFTGFQNSQTLVVQGAFTFFFDRVDSFSVTATPQSIGKMTTVNSTGAISAGTGAYLGASGSLTYTFTYAANSSSAGVFTLTGTGSITAGQTTTAITLSGFSGTASVAAAASGTLQASTSGTVTPFGPVTLNFSGLSPQRATATSPAGPSQGELTFVFDANDSFIASFTATGSLFSGGPISLACIITGGTGSFSGATGSLAATLTPSASGSTFNLTGSGKIVQPAAGVPIVTGVTTAYGPASIAQNTWLEIFGTNLVPASTPAGGVSWDSSPDLIAGVMPTELNNVSVSVNGKPAFIWFFCSAAAGIQCASDQINLLTPLDSMIGLVEIVVTNGSISSAPFTVDMQAVSPSFLLLDASGHVAAQHADYSLLGPATLYPGVSTPAQAGEIVLLYAIGFGLPTTPLVNRSTTQTGQVLPTSVCTIGALGATVAGVNLVSPGLYQFNIYVPAGAPSGDNLVLCMYNGASTPPGALIAVK